jgi:hypothetical protein
MCPHTWIQAETGIVEKLALSGKCTAHYPKEGGIHYSLLNDVRAVRVRACVQVHVCSCQSLYSIYHTHMSAIGLPPRQLAGPPPSADRGGRRLRRAAQPQRTGEAIAQPGKEDELLVFLRLL